MNVSKMPSLGAQACNFTQTLRQASHHFMVRGEEMARLVRALVFTEFWSLIPSIHVVAHNCS